MTDMNSTGRQAVAHWKQGRHQQYVLDQFDPVVTTPLVPHKTSIKLIETDPVEVGHR